MPTLIFSKSLKWLRLSMYPSHNYAETLSLKVNRLVPVHE